MDFRYPRRWPMAATTWPTTPTSTAFGSVDELPPWRRRSTGCGCSSTLAPNHTSSAHPWFAAALASLPGSLARARSCSATVGGRTA